MATLQQHQQAAVVVQLVDENNNSLQQPNARRWRNVLLLLGAVGMVGLIGTIGFTATNIPTEGNVVQHRRQVRSAPAAAPASGNAKPEALTLTPEYVRSLAKSAGAPEVNVTKYADEICYTQGCLEAAVHLLKSINFTVQPCDDFFDFSCGRWIDENEIPPSASRWSQFNVLREEVNRITQEILTAPKDENDAIPINQVKDFYCTCVDTDSLEQYGVEPLRNVLKAHGDWALLLPDGSWEATGFKWLETIGDLRRVYLSSALISVYVDQDIKSADVNTIYVDQASLVLPRDILINENGNYDAILAAYKEYIVSIATEIASKGGGSPVETELQAAADEIIAFETELAKITTKDEDRSDTERMYNPFTIAEYQAITDGFGNDLGELGPLNWLTLLSSIFSTSGVTLTADDRIIVLETAYIGNLTRILAATSPKIISNYVQLRYVRGLGDETTQAMRDISFKFSQVLTGAKEPATRQKTCADASNNGFGMAIGVKYIEQAFDQDAKQEVDNMVEDLRVSFKELLTEATWMDDATTALAHQKADKMKSFMAYPEWLSNKTAVNDYFSGLELEPFQHFASVGKLSQWTGDKALKTLRLPVDRNFWLTYPGVVNAFYAPTYNSITFPAGILQPPFFGSGYPAFLNYGGIGVVIGHEITHGFDNSGRQYDANGNAIPWWSEETLAQYTAKATCIENQYDQYVPPELVDSSNLHVNGLLTLGENIADNGGLRESYLAYQKYVQENGEEGRLPGLEQFSPEQLFFMGYANIWCEAITLEGLTNQLLTDPHSPARFRVRGPLVNNEKFSNAWGCEAGSTMNPDPSSRCILW